MSIPAIGALAGLGSSLGTGAATAPTTATPQVSGPSGTSFGDLLAKGLQDVQDAQTKQDGLAVKAATGDLQDVHDYTIAASEAKLATQLTVALRDKAVSAFNEIMRMQA
ncbi:flagellar hook-basal body complex protein FliE [Motilibacter rhizosphaerae]|uniref:Flagellar hook-basal body complex protein FliE n=1 Tax=Motilibacter rhizosphaerae TaxID=598652 RepID=A0A4Q7NW38_9ACTN|nr:flagellar hook-basal body complex protein FliE [Motilibacter rhizosphaerae]RZS91415.1 flagellar hook-basal body complex protein FliE [Motilibacter rhizosphaerae]